MRHRRPILVVALCAVAAALAATGHWLVRSPLMAAGRWEHIDPSHLAVLAELQSLAPAVSIEAAVVTGFQDRIYRFTYRTKVEAVFRALIEKRFVEMKDEGKIVLKTYAKLDGRPGLPPWWPIDHGSLADIRVYLLNDPPPGRVFMLMVGGNLAIGQIVEH